MGDNNPRKSDHMNDRTQQKTDLIETKIDKDITGGLELSAQGGGLQVVPTDMNQIFEFAKMMAIADKMIAAPFRNNVGACLAVCTQAFGWGMNPFAVAGKAYAVGDKVGYESQLINAVINIRAPLQKRLRATYSGEGADLTCTVTGLLIGEDEPHEYTSPKVGDIKVKNSPLWDTDTEQQLWYYSVRAWARRVVPEVLLNVYSEDELRADTARDVTPPKRPTRDSAKEELATETVTEDGEVIDAEPDDPDEGLGWTMYSETGEELGQYDSVDFYKTFRDWMDTGKMTADFVNNNYETAAVIASERKQLRGLMTMLDGYGFDCVDDVWTKAKVEKTGKDETPTAKADETDKPEPAKESDTADTTVHDAAVEADKAAEQINERLAEQEKAKDAEQDVGVDTEQTKNKEQAKSEGFPLFTMAGLHFCDHTTAATYLSGLLGIVEGECAQNADNSGMVSWKANLPGREAVAALNNGALTARLAQIQKIAYAK